MSESNGAVGRIVKVAGPVVDVEFPPDQLPEILNAVEIFFSLGGEDKKVIAEVAQHLGGSKVRAIALAPLCGWTSGVDRWRAERRAIRAAILEQGFDADRNTFVQSFGGRSLDASNLLIPRMGFLPPEDPRVLGTIDATFRELTENGLVHRYRVDDTEDGVSGCEGAFGICTFWLSDALALAGRVEEAREIFMGMAGRANDLGLFPEEIDPSTGEFLGNYPQAFTHVGLINSAFCLGRALSAGTDDAGEPSVSRAAIIGGPDDPPG